MTDVESTLRSELERMVAIDATPDWDEVLARARLGRQPAPRRRRALVTAAAVALAAAVGFADVWGRASAYGRRPVLAMGAATIAIAVTSPVIGSLAAPGLYTDSARYALLRDGLTGRPGSVLDAVRAAGEAPCTAAAPPALAREVFALTGYRLVAWGPRVENAASIRWADIYERIPGDAERRRANALLTTARTDADRWAETVRAYGVDVVVARSATAEEVGSRGYGYARTRGNRGSYVVFRTGRCA